MARAGDRALTGKVCLLTGATGGIGAVTARRLAELGASLILVVRNADRGAALADALAPVAGGVAMEVLQADLSSLGQVRRLADEVKARHDRLDVLVNNAGGLFGHRRESADGIEMTFALNHLGYFLLTTLLLDRLQASAPARIVNVASEAHRSVTLDFDDLQAMRRYDRLTAYKRSKLANLLFTYELDRRIAGSGVTVNALHPGFVATGIGTAHGFMPDWLWRTICLAAVTPEEGAKTSVHLAASPEVASLSGQYFIRCRQAASSAASYDRQAAERLWQVSETTVNAIASAAA